ncbi:hypothetical protein H8788_00725 [Parabacteroides faecis]|uniref:hypothetical protein n=1 Tax=Parabacteroides TaxID=375288 RepID=UPI000EFE1B2B|nr:MULTISPECIES: hypothetical protein [Parabacteroides]MBC8616255.1 hypothetical protein [Parabacteroides faecis]RHR98373.1 hypothetical protein DWW23_11000 [Parabacteroides sp. AF14-59]
MNIKKICLSWGLSLLAIALLVQCNSKPVSIQVKGFPESAAIHFAQKELTDFMKLAMKQEKVYEKFSFDFVCDTSFHKGEFACKATSPNHFVLSGGDAISLSHAVYTLLETLGYTFDISQTMVPERFDFDAIRQVDIKTVPKVRWRGIRQHVNFPMDISSYPMDEAKEYVNNLVRLRFNKLAVHSYPGFWHEQPQGDSILYGGNYFYDSPHYYKDNESIKKHVRFNDSLFCIPSMEKIYFDKPLKSKKSMEWMNELLTYAKSLGLQIQFSIEPRQLSLEQTVSTAKEILKAYPAIDALELITEEMGGWGPRCTKEEVVETLTKYFGETILNDTLIQSTTLVPQADLNALYSQLGNNMEAVKQLKQDTSLFSKEFKLGIYCTTGYSKAAYHLVRKMMPEVVVAVMPSHGSDGVNRAVRNNIQAISDMKSTEIYSWIEFDGLMYLQQNAIEGINGLFAYTDRLMGGEQLPSVCFNHWRTCENRVTARFASEVALNGSMRLDDFYQAYARRLGITSPEAFAAVMKEINQLDSFSTGGLGNIGFCWTGGWRHAGLFKWMNVDNIDKAMAGYESADRQLIGLLDKTSSQSARDVLSLLENKTAATVIYLKAFKVATAIRTIDEQKMTAKDKQRVVDICNEALTVFEEYIDKYAELLPDRGSEGVIVSVWNSPMYGLKLIRQNLGGVPLEDSWHNENPVDSPPLPIRNE